MSLHLRAQRSAVDSVLGHEKPKWRKPGTILSLAVDGIKVAGEEVRMDGGGLSKLQVSGILFESWLDCGYAGIRWHRLPQLQGAGYVPETAHG